jgi:hypothetical protein
MPGKSNKVIERRNGDRLLSTTLAAARLGMSPATLRAALRRGTVRLDRFALPSGLFFSERAIEALIEAAKR